MSRKDYSLNLLEEYIEKYPDKIDWGSVCENENLTIELMGDDGLVFEANLSMVSLLKIKAEPKEISFTMNKSCSNCKNAYYQDVTNDLDDDVYSCDEFESSFININDSGRPKDFSCNKWESK